jgi:hypothetical protein
MTAEAIRAPSAADNMNGLFTLSPVVGISKAHVLTSAGGGVTTETMPFESYVAQSAMTKSFIEQP